MNNCRAGARISHVALVCSDLDRSAEFYESVFNLTRVGREDLEHGSGLYLSDGLFNLALLRYKGEQMSGLADAARFTGTHHFGLVVDDLAAAETRIKAAGGSFFFQLGEGEDKANFERKFKDPDGIIFDISRHGWLCADAASRGARLRHVALVVRDLDAAARFYQQVFGLVFVARDDQPFGSAVYLSDGTVNLALLRYAGSAVSGLNNAAQFVGTHHFGFVVDDLRDCEARITAAGGQFFFQLGDGEDKQNFERKFKDPDGVIFDISHKGWQLAP